MQTVLKWTCRILIASASILLMGPLPDTSSAEPINPPSHGSGMLCAVKGKVSSNEAIRTIQNAGVPLRIMPLGDSITQGDSKHYTYRYYLWIMLSNAGVNFDFVGSMKLNYSGNPEPPPHEGRSFDSDHEGHWGWRADEILHGRAGQEDQRLSEWLKNCTPDIVLIHLGTNDTIQFENPSSTADELKQIVRTLRNDNPNVVILLGKLIPVFDEILNPRIDELNAQIDGIAAEMGTAASPVIVVDLNGAIKGKRDMYDWLHPNQSGESKIAAAWFEALQDVLYK